MSTRSYYLQILTMKTTYVLLAAIILAPILFKRHLHEIKVFSYLLFVAVIAFIFLVGFDLYDTTDYKNATFDAEMLLNPKPGFGIITSIDIFSVAFFYHVIVFPAYSSLSDRTTARFACSTIITNAFCGIIYVTLGILCLFLFGEDVEPDILKNMATRSGWSSFVLRTIFCLLLLVHIPYIFHPLKEAVLVFN